MLFCLLFSEWSDKHIRPYSMAHAFIHFLDYSLTKLLLQLPRHTRSMDIVWKYIYLPSLSLHSSENIHKENEENVPWYIWDTRIKTSWRLTFHSSVARYFKVNTSVNNLRFFTDRLLLFVLTLSLYRLTIVSDCPFKAPLHNYIEISCSPLFYWPTFVICLHTVSLFSNPYLQAVPFSL